MYIYIHAQEAYTFVDSVSSIFLLLVAHCSMQPAWSNFSHPLCKDGVKYTNPHRKIWKTPCRFVSLSYSRWDKWQIIHQLCCHLLIAVGVELLTHSRCTATKNTSVVFSWHVDALRKAHIIVLWKAWHAYLTMYVYIYMYGFPFN